MELLVNIDVPDIAEGEAFYTRAFGFVPGRRIGSDYLELRGAGASFWLLRKDAGTTGAGESMRDYYRHWTPIHCDLSVDDVTAALAEALAAGATQESDLREHAWGRIVQIADPFGHGWCLLQFTGCGYDEIASPSQPG